MPANCLIQADMGSLGFFHTMKNLLLIEIQVAKPHAWWTNFNLFQISVGLADVTCDSWESLTHKMISAHASAHFFFTNALFYILLYLHLGDCRGSITSCGYLLDGFQHATLPTHPFPQIFPNQLCLHPPTPGNIVRAIETSKFCRFHFVVGHVSINTFVWILCNADQLRALGAEKDSGNENVDWAPQRPGYNIRLCWNSSR